MSQYGSINRLVEIRSVTKRERLLQDAATKSEIISDDFESFDEKEIYIHSEYIEQSLAIDPVTPKYHLILEIIGTPVDG